MYVIGKSEKAPETGTSKDRQGKNSFFLTNQNGRDFTKQIANVHTMRNIGKKPLFFRTDEEKLTYLVRGSEEMPAGHIQSSLESILDFNGKPTYIGRDGDYYVIMQRNEELYKSKNRIENLQVIGGKLTFVIHQEGYDILIHGNEELGKGCYIGRDIGEYQGKPIFVIYDDTLSEFKFNGTIMHGSKVLGKGEGFIKRTDGGEPVYLIKDKNNDENVNLIQGDKNLGTFKNIGSMGNNPYIETGGNLIYRAEETGENGGEVLMWGPYKLGKIIDVDDDVFELEGTDENICKLLGENGTGKSCVFRIKVIKKLKYYGNENKDEYALFINFEGKNYYNVNCSPIKYTE